MKTRTNPIASVLASAYSRYECIRPATEPRDTRSPKIWRSAAFRGALMLAAFSLTGSAIFGQNTCTKPWTVNPPAHLNQSIVNNYLLDGSGNPNTTYLQLMSTSTSTPTKGDLNAQYSELYYSISQLNNAGYCPIELFIFGGFPNTRYLSVNLNDSHYGIAQHLADEDIDPIATVNGVNVNPFLPNTPFPQSTQYYLVPVGLGTVPSTITGGCGITPSEEDNLLDATQRHLSMDWNTDNWYAPLVTPTGNGSTIPNLAHAVDYPDHSDPNTAGSLIVRYYQPVANCTDPTTCGVTLSTPPYFGLRDTSNGCPIVLSSVDGSNGGPKIVFDSNSPQTDNPATYAFAPTDPSSLANTNWLSYPQFTNHTLYANATPDSCYADQSQASPPNVVAWARSPEWVAQPGPDDAYIGGAIPMGVLNNLGSSMVLFQFELPVMPATPCASGNCSLTGTENLRYLSLTLSFNTSGGNGAFVANPDGLNGTAGPVSLISLSDQAFVTTTQNGHQYVNLLVNVEPSLSTNFNTFVTSNSPVPAIQGVAPAANNLLGTYNVFKLTNGYTALDLTKLSHFGQLYNGGKYQAALELDLRNTLPGPGFTQSGLAVPFSTTQYLGNGQGIMGAYVPLVSYVTLTQLPGLFPTFPTAGTPPAHAPANNLSEIYQANQPLNLQNFPEQYWNLVGGGPQQLVCGIRPNPTTQIDFVGTQFSAPVDNANFPTSPANCTNAVNNNNCTQILFQPTQLTGNMTQNWQPGLPLTIEGTGFGFLPELTLPYATTSWGSTQYLTITDTSSGTPNWTSPSSNCQMLILNWSPTTITVVPNVETNAVNGTNTSVSLLTDTSPFSLGASSSCAVTSGDSIQVKVLNPQTGLSSTVSNLQVNTFAGSLN